MSNVAGVAFNTKTEKRNWLEKKRNDKHAGAQINKESQYKSGDTVKYLYR